MSVAGKIEQRHDHRDFDNACGWARRIVAATDVTNTTDAGTERNAAAVVAAAKLKYFPSPIII